MDDSIRYITKIAREANKLVLSEIKDQDIGSSEIELIHYVRHHQGVTQKQACDDLGVDKGLMVRRVQKLIEKGFLEREQNPTDARSQLLYATSKAEEVKDEKVEIEEAFYNYLYAGLTEEERQKFEETLAKLYMRSKKESRSGFPHLKGGHKHEE